MAADFLLSCAIAIKRTHGDAADDFAQKRVIEMQQRGLTTAADSWTSICAFLREFNASDASAGQCQEDCAS